MRGIEIHYTGKGGGANENGAITESIRLKQDVKSLNMHWNMEIYTKAARTYSVMLDKTINESTVRGMTTAYIKRRRLDNSYENDDAGVSTLLRSPRGKPLKIGKYDIVLQDYVNKLRECGG